MVVIAGHLGETNGSKTSHGWVGEGGGVMASEGDGQGEVFGLLPPHARRCSPHTAECMFQTLKFCQGATRHGGSTCRSRAALGAAPRNRGHVPETQAPRHPPTSTGQSLVDTDDTTTTQLCLWVQS